MSGLKVIILNGSPKGMISVTMQYMRYLEKRFPQHSFEYINAAQSCTKFEKNTLAFEELMEKIKASDLILWAYPLYFLLVCSQYKRFIELIFERKREDVFNGKYTAALSTSIHFFDNTALNYIQAVCDDLGMNFLEGITAEMEDLLNPKFRNSFDQLFLEWEAAVRSSSICEKTYTAFDNKQFMFSPKNSPNSNGLSSDARICIVGDLEDENSNIRKMANSAFTELTHDGIKPDLVDLSQLKFGPCTGCLKCGFDNVCAYEDKDDFIRLHRETILKADIIIFAGAMHDRYLSSTWQRYLERTFNRTHKPTINGKQIGFLISGPLSQNQNTREILKAYTEVNDANLVGFVTDESADNDRISAEITELTSRAVRRFKSGLKKPQSFPGVGGMKIFRDDIYTHLRFVFQADHKYYKQHGLYDFPQKKLKMRLSTSMMVLLTKIQPMRKVIRQRLRGGMLNPYKKLFDKVVPLK